MKPMLDSVRNIQILQIFCCMFNSAYKPVPNHEMFVKMLMIFCISLKWRHNERCSVSNHQRLHCLLNCRFRRRSKKTSNLRVTGLCVKNSPVTDEFPAQKASNLENVSIWWRHHVISHIDSVSLSSGSSKFEVSFKKPISTQDWVFISKFQSK